MGRVLSPKEVAARLERFARAGIRAGVVIGLDTALPQDRAESAARAPRQSGRLGRTVRVVRPRLWKGGVRAGLKAGSRAVLYASVLQSGKVGFPPKDRTKAHVIQAKGAEKGRGGVLRLAVRGRAVFARQVRHPGSRFKPQEYLRINRGRGQREVDRGLGKKVQEDVG